MPTLSVVIATTDGGVALTAVLDSITEQTLAVGGEVLLVASARARLPPEIDGSRVRIHTVQCADVFGLRAAGVAAATGATIAVTEDHVLVGDDWARLTLRAHAERPEAGAVGGPVENGSRDRLTDWANFLMTFGSFLRPITAARHQRLPAIANLSIKRSALPERALGPGELEFVVLPQLAAAARLAFDDGPLVWHLQSHRPFATMCMHFHNGRVSNSITGVGQPRPGWSPCGRLRRLRQLVTDALVTVRERPLPLRARASLPMILLLCTAHVAGEWVGDGLGPGRSAERLV